MFGGKTLTATDVVVAGGLNGVGDSSKVAHLFTTASATTGGKEERGSGEEKLIEKAHERIRVMLENTLGRDEDVPGGGAGLSGRRWVDIDTGGGEDEGCE